MRESEKLLKQILERSLAVKILQHNGTKIVHANGSMSNYQEPSGYHMEKANQLLKKKFGREN